MTARPPINDPDAPVFDPQVDLTEPPADPDHADDGIMTFNNVSSLERGSGVPMSHRLDPTLAERGFEARMRTWRPG